ncbi:MULTISPECIES: GH12 family glycosyl hydrolase domain-containing protein [Xanthomonas]|uniref:Cellulase n=1 Tax=Xanthomonas indica TaxID=2912242 RepID=A0AAU8I576_9XANT|nr:MULTISPECIES: cellulase [Xanthomonas]MCI2263206.1 cellulase [Xanthomonas indica]UYC13040.1 cellulase [Xanthomonas sp. CFBP 8445]
MHASAPVSGAASPRFPVTLARSLRGRTRTVRALLAAALLAVAPMALAGPYQVYGNQYAWVNNFNDPNNVIQGTFHSGSTPSMTVTFNFPNASLYGYPAILRGSHYGFNPTSDRTFPRQVSALRSLPATFAYSSGGSNLGGDFAYDLFFRWDSTVSSSAIPQTEVMIWGGHNSYPIGTLTASNVISAGGYTFDLWEGMNSAAGYYVYTFIPHNTAGQPTLPSNGNLNIDIKPFLTWLHNHRAQDGRFSNAMYLHVVEAGFEVVRGNGWAWIQANIGAN